MEERHIDTTSDIQGIDMSDTFNKPNEIFTKYDGQPYNGNTKTEDPSDTKQKKDNDKRKRSRF
jgi:hypothetical protein